MSSEVTYKLLNNGKKYFSDNYLWIIYNFFQFYQKNYKLIDEIDFTDNNIYVVKLR